MRNPYDRERQLMPYMVEATRRGVRVDRPLLASMISTYEAAVLRAENEVRATLHAPDLQITSSRALGAALDAAGAVTHHVFTAKGNRSMAREVLETTIADEHLRNLIVYYNTITKSLSDFQRNWYDMSSGDGRVHPNWNQVRSRDDFGGGKGARTGRMSCDHPNLMNVPNEYSLTVPEGYPEPPILRKVFLPEEGHVWCKRDFSGQEIRIAAHFEDGILLEAYIANPRLDPHGMAKDMIAAVAQLEFARPQVKITAFQIIYGGGPKAVSTQVGCSYEEGMGLINAYLTTFPGIAALQKDTRRRGKMGIPITTWGGRRYLSEPAKMVEGRWREYHYKLLNYLIQGSAADQTKECVIDWHLAKRPDDIFLAQVHDEINISAPEDGWQESMDILRRIMDQDLFDCPMRSEGFVGPNWADIELLEEAEA